MAKYAEDSRSIEGTEFGRKNCWRSIVSLPSANCCYRRFPVCSIIISGNTFYCIDKSWDEQLSPDHDICAAYFLQDFEFSSTSGLHGLQMLVGMRIFTMPLTFSLSVTSTESYRDVAFCIRTSGSTGPPKTVLVPSTCIMPNVLSLSNRFGLSDRDVIFVCSPPTFDPFVLDIVMGLRVGATLLMVDNSIRLSPKRLLDVLFPGITFMQMTPSMFTRWSKTDMLDIIFGPQTTLRTLVLGGERFPVLPRAADCRVSVYNIYGITEVSCWSMIQKVQSQDNQTDIPLGEVLDQSIVLQIRNEIDGSVQADHLANGSKIGQLYIGSCSRKCVILGMSEDDDTLSTMPDVVFRATGDLVELSKEGNYYYRGRCSRTIKRFGCRISLPELEAVLQTHPSVEQCASCFIEELNRLVIYFKSDTDDSSLREALWSIMRAKLRAEMLPDELHRIEQFPLSAHGKICPKGLGVIFENLKQSRTKECITPVDYFCAELNAMGIVHESQPIESGRTKKLKPNSSFMDRGGTSFNAICLHATLEEHFKIQLPGLTALLLDPLIPLEKAIDYIQSKIATSNSNCLQDDVTIQNQAEKLLSIERQYDLKKCIDSRASIIYCQGIGAILSVGSHAGLLVTINIETNAIISHHLFPDRIECSVNFFTFEANVYGIVGCYDGFLYCFNPWKGAIAWKYDAGGMIKCAPLVVPQTNVIIFGSYSTTNNLHCIAGGNCSATLRWKIRIGTKPILCQPIVLGDDGAEFVLVATLDGTIASISIATGCLAWKRTTQRSVPIFSTPTLLPEYNKIACCSVDGTLGIYETKQGTELTIHSLPGNVFSSLVMLKYPLDRVDFIVGCYDRHVHCVEYLPANSNTLIPKWKIEVQSQIYATPLLVEGYLVVCTTSGWINLIDTRDSSDAKNSIISSMKLNGELFASPVGFGKKVFIGCRDNFLYEILLNI
ncbi:beta-alanine-activating enzyme isoform X2 [Anopheles gambiae]|uniref:beta-alanine-activating enzyme isoform X2 n=1 Tax=Anopheles gambiae TaxID=7165 RepID=UPI002AC8B977|nr:beta-alanine-activating enzyme isoform X2 [Anopheles gambiae]